MTQPLTPDINFHGGMLTFFLGVWERNSPATPDDDEWAFFYNIHGISDSAIPDYWTGNPRWQEFNIPVGTNSDWAVLDISSNPPVTQASELYHWPQQWGFTILDESGPPTGALAFDNFRIIPEPATILLLGIGIMMGMLSGRLRSP